MEKTNPDNLIADDFGRPQADLHPDPLTGALHSHPVGTGVGATVGATVGGIAAAAMIGAGVSGPAAPIGGIVGAVVAAIAGAAAGHAMAEHYEGSDEDLYWRKNYSTRPYYQTGAQYDEYAPAYQYGWEARRRYEGKNFDEVESDLAEDWDRFRGNSTLNWERARAATRDAWERMQGDAKTVGRRVEGAVSSDRAEALTPRDVVSTSDDLVREPERDFSSGHVETNPIRTNPDFTAPRSNPDLKTMGNPDDPTGRAIRQATNDAADEAVI